MNDTYEKIDIIHAQLLEDIGKSVGGIVDGDAERHWSDLRRVCDRLETLFRAKMYLPHPPQQKPDAPTKRVWF